MAFDGRALMSAIPEALPGEHVDAPVATRGGLPRSGWIYLTLLTTTTLAAAGDFYASFVVSNPQPSPRGSAS